MNPKIQFDFPTCAKYGSAGYTLDPKKDYDALFSVARAPAEGGLCMTIIDDIGRPLTVTEIEYRIANHAELMEPTQLVADPLAGLLLGPGSPVMLASKG